MIDLPVQTALLAALDLLQRDPATQRLVAPILSGAT
jgi:hypothetical protein